MVKKKQEALTVNRLINEILVGQLSIPLRQIVNDTSFAKYTGSQRPDLLISEFEYDGTNDDQYIKNLVAYAEVKDNCTVDDTCLLYTSPSPRDRTRSRMPSSA